jgi:hypothetical protein
LWAAPVSGAFRGGQVGDDGEQAGVLQQGASRLQEVLGVGRWSRPAQQKEIRVGCVACDPIGIGVAVKGMMDSSGRCGDVGKNGVVIEVDDDLPGLGVVIEQAPGLFDRQRAWMVR